MFNVSMSCPFQIVSQIRLGQYLQEERRIVSQWKEDVSQRLQTKSNERRAIGTVLEICTIKKLCATTMPITIN